MNDVDVLVMARKYNFLQKRIINDTFMCFKGSGRRVLFVLRQAVLLMFPVIGKLTSC